MMHDPDLTAIDALDAPAIRHYAAIGAVVTLAAQIDHAMHSVLFGAVGGEGAAISGPEDLRPTAARREALDAAVRSARDTPAEWTGLYRDLLAVTTADGPHNPDRPSLIQESSRMWLEDGRMIIESIFESGADGARQSTADLLALAVRQQAVRDRLFALGLQLMARA